MFEQYFFEVLGTDNVAYLTEQKLLEIPFRTITEQQGELLTSEATDTEIRDMFANMDPNRSPGPDGWNAQLFREFWDPSF